MLYLQRAPADHAARRAQLHADCRHVARAFLLLQPVQSGFKRVGRVVQLFLGFGGAALVKARFGVAHAAGQLALGGAALARVYRGGQAGTLASVFVEFELLKIAPTLLFGGVVGVIARIQRDAPILQLGDAGAQRVQKRAVVADEQYRAVEAAQFAHKLLYALRVQIDRAYARHAAFQNAYHAVVRGRFREHARVFVHQHARDQFHRLTKAVHYNQFLAVGVYALLPHIGQKILP